MENQVQQLLEAITAMTMAMQRQQNQQASSTSVNIISNFESFDPKIEQFKTYRERLEIHFQIKKIFEDKAMCAKLLLQYVGPSTYTLLSTLAAPKNINQLEYDDIVTILDTHFNPKKNVLVEQHRFLCEVQNENQSISDFVAKLQNRGTDCEFFCECKKSVADIFLRAQFIRGVHDGFIREQLLQTPKATFRQIVEKATALEAAKMDNKIIGNSSTCSTSDIHKTQWIHTHKRKSRSRNSSRNRTSKSKTRVNYRELGIEGLCLRCGRNNHVSTECSVNKMKLKCKACGKVGHVRQVCIQSKMKQKEANRSYDNISNSIETYITDVEDINVNQIIDIYNNTFAAADTQKFFIKVILEGKEQKFEVDSGAGYTLLPEKDFRELNIKAKIKKANIAFRSYTGDIFVPLGVVTVNVKYRNKVSKEDMYIVSSEHTALLGRVWIRHLRINLADIDLGEHKQENMKQINSLTQIEQQFAEIFLEKVGCIPDLICSLKLHEDAKPVFIKERQVPFALREKVERELDSLEREGIITKVNTSNWGSPLVVIPKPDGNVRLCVDYKVAVNPQLEAAHYPIKRIDEIFNCLKDSKYFCKLDLYKAYLHVRVDDESKQIQTISTHRGTYLMNRLSFGIKTAPSEFNRILDQILRGLEGTISYFDDIIIHGQTQQQCEDRLIKCLERLNKYQLHINKKKCEYFKTEIKYLGYVVSHNKISKCKDKVRAIMDLPRPTSIDDVSRFLGMVTYYAKFIPHVSTITFPLRQLLEKNRKFLWTNKCEEAFKRLKQEILNDRVLVPYDEKLPVTLACDASPTGIAAVLSHEINGEEHPIAFISRSLTKSENNYSQLDREALAIVFAVDKFFMYLHGREFILLTDNRPISRIFHQSAKTPAMTSARLLRYASFLQGFNYKIRHRKAEDNVNADCLSRAPISNTTKFKHFLDEEVKIIQDQIINTISSITITAKKIAEETEHDTELSKLKQDLINGANCEAEYTIQDGVIFKNNRVVIPVNLREEILQELHHTHVGIVKMKQLARKYCFWKGIDADIEHLVKACACCAKVRKTPPKVITHHWEEPRENFQRVHIDYAGPFQNYNFFVLVDAKSKWPEIRLVKDAPTSEKTIDLLQDIFGSHGLPETIVSDNATIFQSSIFKNFCVAHGIIQKFIAPGHPATNGLAERYVQILKSKLNAMEDDKMPLNIKVQQILFRYRATPLANGQSPAKRYLGRDLRIKLDALRPVKLSKSTLVTPSVRQISVGDRVQVRWYDKNKPTWKFGTVKAKFGRLHYRVKLDNGYELKRHINQIVKSSVNNPKKSVTFSEPLVQQKPKIEEVHIERRASGTINPSLEQFIQNRHLGTSVEAMRPNRVRRPPAYLKDYVSH